MQFVFLIIAKSCLPIKKIIMNQEDNIQQSNNFAVRNNNIFTDVNNCILLSCSSIKHYFNIEILSQQFPYSLTIGNC